MGLFVDHIYESFLHLGMTGKFENAKDPEDSEGDEGSRHLAEVGVRRRDEEVGMRRGG